MEHNDAQSRLIRDATTGREKRANEGTVFAISPMPRRCALRHVPPRELDVELILFRRGRARRIGPSHYRARDGQRHGIGAAEFLSVMPKGVPPSATGSSFVETGTQTPSTRFLRSRASSRGRAIDPVDIRIDAGRNSILSDRRDGRARTIGDRAQGVGRGERKTRFALGRKAAMEAVGVFKETRSGRADEKLFVAFPERSGNLFRRIAADRQELVLLVRAGNEDMRS